MAWWTTTLDLVVYAHHHYRDGQSGAGVTLQHSPGGAAPEGVRVDYWGHFLGYGIDIAPCRPAVAVSQQPCSP